MLNRAKIFNLIALIAILVFMNGCVTNPATQKKEFILISTENEVALGQDMDQELHRQLQISKNQEMQSRLDKIGKRVAAGSDRQDLKYNFSIVNDKELNAFAVPGGFIYVNSGLLDSATDDELACILGHELGHIAARHSVKRMQAVMGYQLIAAIALGADKEKEDLAQALDITFGLVALGFSREDEYLADRLSVRYSKRSGYDPQGMVSFFKKLQAEEKKKGSGSTLVFLSSHPPIDERIKQIEEEIALNP